MSSYNSLFGLGSHSEDAALVGAWPVQDDAATQVVVDESSNGNDGELQVVNTEDRTTTGPNSYLPAGIECTSGGVHVTVPHLFDGVDAFTELVWVKPNGTARDWMGNWSAFDGLDRQWLVRNADAQFFVQDAADSNNANATAGANLSDDTWGRIAVVADGDNIRSAVNESFGSDVALSGPYIPASTEDWALVGRGHSQDGQGVYAGRASFTRALSASEIGEWASGPEPINSVAPAVSGTETVGETLSVTNGTWGLDAPFSSGSNGTITFAYQWTRSDDATGTNEADISGATSSTYTLVAADEGKFIRCRVRASNNGGFDADADTNSDFTGEIQASSGTTITAAVTTGGATCSADATFSPGTKTATAAPTAGGAQASATATFTAPVFTATAAPTTGGATASASATFGSGTFTATASPTAGGATASASATFVTGTFTATAGVETGGAQVSAAATFAAGTKTATAAVTSGGATAQAAATFTAPVFTASAAVTAGGAIAQAAAEFLEAVDTLGPEFSSRQGPPHFRALATRPHFATIQGPPHFAAPYQD